MTSLSERLTKECKAQIDSWIREACSDNNLPYVAAFVNWRFDGRLTSAAGKAYQFPSPGLVKLAPGMWERGDEDERRNTVKHECCHLLVWILHGKVKDNHGPEWQECMRRAGEPPAKYHNLYIQDLRKKYIGVCECGTWAFTKQQVEKGLRYCKKCNSPIRFTGETTRDT